MNSSTAHSQDTTSKFDHEEGRMIDPKPATRELYRVTEAMTLLSLSRSVLYEELRCGRLRSVHRGRTRLVPAAAIKEYVALLEQEAAAPPRAS
jgi:excisionase family DNA binding protein